MQNRRYPTHRSGFESLESRLPLTIQMVADYSSGQSQHIAEHLTPVQDEVYFSFSETSEIWKLAGNREHPEFTTQLSETGSVQFLANLIDTLVVGTSGADWSSIEALIPHTLARETILHGGVGAQVTEVYHDEALLTFGVTDWIQVQPRYSITDGTSAGTFQTASRNAIEEFVRVPNGVFYVASTPSSGSELWFRPSGSLGMGSIVKEIADGETSSFPQQLTRFRDQILFSAASSSGRELWISDGSLAGTRQLVTLHSGSMSATSLMIEVAQDTAYFLANEGQATQLWSYDGIGVPVQQTREFGQVLDFAIADQQDDERVLIVHTNDTGSSLRDLSTGELLLVASELITVDVTRSGDFYAMVADSDRPLWLVNHDSIRPLITQTGTVELIGEGEHGTFFELSADQGPVDLYHTQGTADTTSRLRGIHPRDKGVVAGDYYYFRDSDDIRRVSSSEIQTVVPPQRRGHSTYVQSATQVGNHAALVASPSPFQDYTSFHAPILLSNGQNLTPIANRDFLWANHGNFPVQSTFYRTGSRFYFASQDVTEQLEIWETDLTRGGTGRLDDQQIAQIFGETDLNIFNVDAALAQLFEDPALQRPWPTIQYGETRFTAVELAGSTYFLDTRSNPNRLMRINDNQIVESVTELPRVVASPRNAFVHADQIYFAVWQNGVGTLWTSDGTDDGTQPVDIADNPVPPNYRDNDVVYLGTAGDWSYLRGRHAGAAQVWGISPQGRIAPVVMVSSTPTGILPLGTVANTSYVWLEHGADAGELWGLNANGTANWYDLQGDRHVRWNQLISYGSQQLQETIYFAADDGLHGSELWKIDRNGPALAADIRPGNAGSAPTLLLATESAIFFTADDGVHGREIWSVTYEAPLVGDLNEDTTVDFYDFQILAAHFGNQTEMGPAEGDINKDGEVSFADFLLLSQNYGNHP